MDFANTLQQSISHFHLVLLAITVILHIIFARRRGTRYRQPAPP